jgi:outer membrane receptor for ferrienterochelin and colicins
MHYILILLGLLCLSASNGWGAEVLKSYDELKPADMSLEQLLDARVERVYGASKYEQKVTQAPSSVSIITADEIKKFGYRTLGDALKGVRGLYVSDDRNYSYLGTRGFLRPGDYNTRILVLINGHRMNDNIYDSAYIGRDTIDVDLIERVEVIRGPSSSIYGSSAFFGVINIVTKGGKDVGGAEGSVEAGSFDSYKGRFTFGRMLKHDIEWLASGTFYTSEGHERLYYPEFDQRISPSLRATNNGVARNRDGEEALNLFSSLGYQDFTLSGMFNYREKQVPTASFGTIFNDNEERTIDYRSYLDLKYDHGFNDRVRLMGRLFYDDYRYYGSYPFNYALAGDPFDRVVYKDDTVGQWLGTEWQLTARFLDRYTLVAGGEYRENFNQHQFSYDETPRFYYLRDERSTRILSAFAQAEISIITNLTLTAGARYDHYFGSFGGTLNPRAGLIYNPWKDGTFKALYGQAFRAPNAYEQVYFKAQRALPPLDPETIQTYELVYEQYFSRQYRAGISGYYYEVQDLIDQATDSGGRLYFANLQAAHAMGVELEAEAKFDYGVLARCSYALQRGVNEETDGRLTSSPEHLAKLNLAVPLYKQKIFAGFELQYQSKTETLSGRHADDFLIANFTLFSREIVKGLEVSASIYNLFDTKYAYPGAGDHLQDTIPQDGRSFRLKMTYKF